MFLSSLFFAVLLFSFLVLYFPKQCLRSGVLTCVLKKLYMTVGFSAGVAGTPWLGSSGRDRMAGTPRLTCLFGVVYAARDPRVPWSGNRLKRYLCSMNEISSTISNSSSNSSSGSEY